MSLPGIELQDNMSQEKVSSLRQLTNTSSINLKNLKVHNDKFTSMQLKTVYFAGEGFTTTPVDKHFQFEFKKFKDA